jgi:Mg2+ and Co2+ transporter CorA
MIEEMSRRPEQTGSKARLPRRDFGTPEISIIEEISLLREIKDIRDELNILHRVLNDQRDVVDKLGHHLNWHETRRFDDFMRASGLKSREDRIEKLKDDAQRVQDSVCPYLFVQCISN